MQYGLFVDQIFSISNFSKTISIKKPYYFYTVVQKCTQKEFTFPDQTFDFVFFFFTLFVSVRRLEYVPKNEFSKFGKTQETNCGTWNTQVTWIAENRYFIFV